MNKKVKTSLIILVILVLLALFYSVGGFSIFNEPLNKLIAGTPDKSCAVDSDCAIKSTSCEACDCGSAVNKDWNKFCPFKTAGMVSCDVCPRYDSIKCINGECVKS